jgi:type IV secretion system protein VirB5
MLFKRAHLHYGQSERPVTPYQKAAQVWDNRLGSARVQARNWRLMAFGCLGVVAGLSAELAILSTTSRVTPYVVEVEKDGAVHAVAPAIEHYDPSDAEIAAELAQFIEHVRAVSTDPVVVKQNWLKAYDYATDRAAETLNAYARENDPFAKIGQRSVTVEITSIVRASPTSFQIRWREKAFENGAAAGVAGFTAVLTLVLKPPRDAATLRANPLGIYVNAISWSRDADVSGLSTPPKASTPTSPSQNSGARP